MSYHTISHQEFCNRIQILESRIGHYRMETILQHILDKHNNASWFATLKDLETIADELVS
jgi:RNA binding exosome subunit